MDDLAAGGEQIVVTKRGKPVALVAPPPAVEPRKTRWGAGRGTVQILGDIVGPMDTTRWTLDGIPWEERHDGVGWAGRCDRRRHRARE